MDLIDLSRQALAIKDNDELKIFINKLEPNIAIRIMGVLAERDSMAGSGPLFRLLENNGDFSKAIAKEILALSDQDRKVFYDEVKSLKQAVGIAVSA